MLGAAMLGANDGAVTEGPLLLAVSTVSKTLRTTGILRKPVSNGRNGQSFSRSEQSKDLNDGR